MSQKIPENDLLSQAMSAYFERRDALTALEKIDTYILKNPNFIPFPYQLKSDILRDQGKIDEALNIIEAGLVTFPVSHDLLKRKAELLGVYKGDFANALQAINQAIVFFEGNSISQINFLKNLSVRDELDFHKNYTLTRVELKTFQQELSRLNSINIINSRVDTIKDGLEKRLEENEKMISSERLKNVELLGIFTAILGFIFANVQKSSAINNFSDLLLFDLAILIPLAIFIYLISRITGK